MSRRWTDAGRDELRELPSRQGEELTTERWDEGPTGKAGMRPGRGKVDLQLECKLEKANESKN